MRRSYNPALGGAAWRPLSAVAAFFLLALGSPFQGSAQVSDDVFEPLEARAVGPFGTSGRIASLAAVGSRPDVIYIGAATGGLWKSTDAGFTWNPVFDDQPASSVGAVEIHPKQHDVVWVGTGEANVRNSMGHGRGVFKSMDGGDSWRALGLEETERVSRILLHPDNPDVAYIGALGKAWAANEERGVYKTSDGGDTWEKVLYVDENTGVAEMAMDPTNPDHILAAMWEYRRWPWFFESGGEGSGLYESWDGGKTWEKQTVDDGLPSGELGRIGLAWAVSDPNVVYAIVEASSSVILRSNDAGRTWSTVNSGPGASPRPFYYSRIAVDPTNENRIYRLHTFLNRSDDAGETFYNVGNNGATVHLDHHALWIHPEDGKTLVVGNDGGVYISHNRGESWRFVENLPLAQFYHLSVDMETPFNIYGGLQDNGSWKGPSQVWVQPGFTGDVIQTHDWVTIGFGDGFAAGVDPEDSNRGYSSWQGGNLQRWDLRNNEWKNIRPPDSDTLEMRYNWNAGFAQDPHDPGTIYYGSQHLMRSRDRGDTWTILSPDLTTNDPEKQNPAETGGLTYDDSGAENHTTILAVAPSPLEEGTIWVGTDDGNVQVTQDDGATWTNVAESLRGVDAGAWVPHVEASVHVAGRAYVVVNDHRRGTWDSYVFVTENYGANWSSIADGLDGPVHIMEEDPVNPNLLWAGTEFGLFYSLDRGESWTKWTRGVPTVPVYSLVTHTRDHDLVIGTHGRGALVLDDIQPLRSLADTPSLADTALAVFPIPDAYQAPRGTTGPFYFPGHTQAEGANRPFGALVTYRLGEVAEGDTVRIEVLDGSGQVVRTVLGETEAGTHRWAWPLNRDGRYGRGGSEPSADSIRPGGLPVLPGDYTVRISHGDWSSESGVVVHPDPRLPFNRASVAARYEALDEVAALNEAVGFAMRRLGRTASGIDDARERVEDMDDGDEKTALTEELDAAEAALDSLRNRMRPNPEPPIQGFRRSDTLGNDIGGAMGRLGSSGEALTQGDRTALEIVRRTIPAWLDDVDGFYTGAASSLADALRDAGVAFLKLD